MNNADVILEIPASWFENPLDGERHQRLYASILVALARLSVTVRPVYLPFGVDQAERLFDRDQLVISFHSRGDSGNVLRLKETYVQPYYTIDSLGYSGFSELGRRPEAFVEMIEWFPLDQATQLVETTKRHLIEKNQSKYPQPQRGLRRIPEGCIFLPLQTVDDPVATLSMLDQLDVARKLAEYSEFLGRDVLVKRHPFCQSRRVEAELAELAQTFENFQVVDASIHELIERAECVVGCNSGVLFEALVLGARVISFGSSDFQVATTSVSKLDDLVDVVFGDDVQDQEFRLRFLGWYLSEYCINASDIDEIEERIRAALESLDIPQSTLNARQEEIFEFWEQHEKLRRNQKTRR